MQFSPQEDMVQEGGKSSGRGSIRPRIYFSFASISVPLDFSLLIYNNNGDKCSLLLGDHNNYISWETVEFSTNGHRFTLWIGTLASG